MVRLEEVDDEEFVKEQPGPQDEDDWDTDDGTLAASHLSTSSPNPHYPHPFANSPAPHISFLTFLRANRR